MTTEKTTSGLNVYSTTVPLAEAFLPRLPFNQYAILVCEMVSSRSSCLHRKQGAIIVQDKRILSTGYNGSAPGDVHCSDMNNCLKEFSGICRAAGLHGENNAILSAARMGISITGADMYCVYSPCRACCNAIKAAGIKRVYYRDLYSTDPCAPDYLASLGVFVRCIGMEYKVSINKLETPRAEKV